MNKQQVEADFNKFLEEEGLTKIYKWGNKWILLVLLFLIILLVIINYYL